MFPRRYFAGRYFAPVYWPQSQGIAAEVIHMLCAGLRISPRLDGAPDIEAQLSGSPVLGNCNG